MLLASMLLGCGASSTPAVETIAQPVERPRLAHYARLVHAQFDPARAHATVAYVDRHFRVRGNGGYVKTLERVRAELADAGLPSSDVRTLELGPVEPTWTPRAAALALVGADGELSPLVQFADEADRDRACLLVRSDARPEGELELVRAEAVRAGASARGRVVLAEGDPRVVFREHAEAAGIVVLNLEPYHRGDEQPEVAQFGYLPEHLEPAFGFSISPRVYARLREATETGPARVRVGIDVRVGRSAATAVEARIAGTDPEAGAIVFVAHVDEPGANDNGSGVAAQAELAGALHRLVRSGALPRPRRTLVFLWGQEMEVSRTWLASPPLPVGAGLVMDMVGQDPDGVGAPFLIERMPDPGAVWLRAPDEHTEWGASEVDADTLQGHFLNDLTAAAAREVERLDGPWRWRTNPFEGGSDHVPFLQQGLPALLAWHFTDSAYHTTLDRIDRVSGPEMRRVAATLGAVALAMAAGDEADGLELVEVVVAAGTERFATLREASAALVQSGASNPVTEARVRRAWVRWYAEALGSIGPFFAQASVLERVAQAREAAREAWPSGR
jgi:aminopeptidase YwaD